MQEFSGIIPLVAGVVVGIVLGAIAIWIFLSTRVEAARSQIRNESQIEIARLDERASSASKELGHLQTRINEGDSRIEDLQGQLSTAKNQCAQLQERASRLPGLESQVTSFQFSLQEESNRAAGLAKHVESQQQRIDLLNAQMSDVTDKRDKLIGQQEDLKTQLATTASALEAERKKEVERLALKDEMSSAFKLLASEILEEKATRFTEQNKANIGDILNPLKVKIQEFRERVDHVYDVESKDRTALGSQVGHLVSLNQQLSQDAQNLARALKGSSKTQGNWGELILERVLETSGMRKGHEYDVRETYSYEDGTRGQPDVIINLPEAKHLIIDAKVSLTDYEQYVNATNDVDRTAAIQRHIASMRRHVKELFDRDYPSLEGLNPLNFVIMFVPIESAFVEAIREDVSLWEESFKKNVLLVSPTSLLFVLRTVAYIWRQEDQARNVREIAKAGGDLYDKFVGFIEDMQELGDRLERANKSYQTASKKLSTGNGNLIKKAERLKELGVTPSKSLPIELIEISQEEPFVLPDVAAVDAQSLGNGNGDGPA